MQYDLSNQIIVDYLEKIRKCPRIPLITWAPAKHISEPEVIPHRHSHWEIKFMAHATDTPQAIPYEITLIPPGFQHNVKSGICALFNVGSQQFSWYLSILGHRIAVDADQREASTLLMLLDTCRSAFAGGNPGPELRKALSDTLIAALIEFWSSADNSQQNHTPEIIALNYIDNHLDMPGLTLETIARYVNCSLRQLHYRFRNRFKMSPGEYICCSRMRRAQKLLAETDCDIAFAAERCGFTDHDYFSRVFKRYHGATPSEYQKKSRRKQLPTPDSNHP